jgi:acetyl-CoA C-acetyltransferase
MGDVRFALVGKALEHFSLQGIASKLTVQQEMQSMTTFILGGYQTNFARHTTRDGKGLLDLLREATEGALDSCGVDASEIETAHVGNFASELFLQQGHLGAVLLEAVPSLGMIPTARHEAACASGSIAILSAMASLEAGIYDVALVVGVEVMRNLPGFDAQSLLGAAALVPQETEGVLFPWAEAFSHVAEEYDHRYGLQQTHLAALAQSFFANAKRNPNAQTRSWIFTGDSFSENDASNPKITGRIRKNDCCQITDGAVALILVSERFAAKYAQRHARPLQTIPAFLGFGHRSSRVTLRPKLTQSRGQEYVFPSLRQTIVDAFSRAKLPGPEALQAIESHDCFTPTAYAAIDHFGITAPGKSYQAIEDGRILFNGKLPLNPSGGLMGGGHPVGASGVRMVLDAYKQTTNTAGEYQVPNASRVATLNIGGSIGTSVCFIVGAPQ